MTKTRDAAHESGDLDEKTDQRSTKKMDLHRYQVMTIPMELQQELASLKGPRLSDEDMKPLPPIEEVVKARQGTSSNPPASRAKTLYFLAKHRIVLLGTALVLALVLLLLRLGGHESPSPTTAVESVKASELPKTPIGQQDLAPQPAQATAAPSTPNTAQITSNAKEPEVKTAASSATQKSAQALTKPVASTKATNELSPSIDSSKKPPRRAAFKPE